MSYQTSTASGCIDLVQQLVTFLVAHGWTQDMSQTDGAGWRAHLHLGGTYVNLRAGVGENLIPSDYYGHSGEPAAVYGYLGDGYNGSLAWDKQSGRGIDLSELSSGRTLVVGFRMVPATTTTFYFFCDAGGDNVTVVVQTSPGDFGFLGFGSSLSKAGTYSLGAYYFGSRNALSIGYNNAPTQYLPFANSDDNFPNSACLAFVRVDCDSVTGKWFGVGAGSANNETVKKLATPNSSYYSPPNSIPVYGDHAGWTDGATYGYEFFRRLTSIMNGQVNLVPIHLWVPRDAGGYSLLGWVPNIFTVFNHSLPGGSTYTLGADDYLVFPTMAVKKIA